MTVPRAPAQLASLARHLRAAAELSRSWMDYAGAAARGCPRHTVAALDGIVSAHVDSADSKDHNEWERKALELAEERSQLG